MYFISKNLRGFSFWNLPDPWPEKLQFSFWARTGACYSQYSTSLEKMPDITRCDSLHPKIEVPQTAPPPAREGTPPSHTPPTHLEHMLLALQAIFQIFCPPPITSQEMRISIKWTLTVNSLCKCNIHYKCNLRPTQYKLLLPTLEGHPKTIEYSNQLPTLSKYRTKRTPVHGWKAYIQRKIQLLYPSICISCSFSH